MVYGIEGCAGPGLRFVSLRLARGSEEVRVVAGVNGAGIPCWTLYRDYGTEEIARAAFAADDLAEEVDGRTVRFHTWMDRGVALDAAMVAILAMAGR